jgi:hypothetical protein
MICSRRRMLSLLSIRDILMYTICCFLLLNLRLPRPYQGPNSSSYKQSVTSTALKYVLETLHSVISNKI